MMINTSNEAPHDWVLCRCDECLAEQHSYHDEHVPGCPICDPASRKPPEPPTFKQELCYECLPQVGIARTLTGRTRVIDNADPTESYEMTCGHWGI